MLSLYPPTHTQWATSSMTGLTLMGSKRARFCQTVVYSRLVDMWGDGKSVCSEEI